MRLKVDPTTDLALRTGMSADVTVDTGVSRGLPELRRADGQRDRSVRHGQRGAVTVRTNFE